MKIIRIIMLLGLLPLLASCSSDGLGFDSAEQAGAGQVTFRFGLQADVTAGVRTRSEQPEPIARMWYAIADERGEVIKPLYQKLEADFSKLTIEGLGYGDYTVVFLATTHPESDITVDEPALLSDAWLVNHVEKAPLDEAWFYKKIALHIGRGAGSGDADRLPGTLCGQGRCRFGCVVRLYVAVYPQHRGLFR